MMHGHLHHPYLSSLLFKERKFHEYQLTSMSWGFFKFSVMLVTNDILGPGNLTVERMDETFQRPTGQPWDP